MHKWHLPVQHGLDKVQPRVNKFSWGLRFGLEEKQRMSHHHLSDAMGAQLAELKIELFFGFFLTYFFSRNKAASSSVIP